MYSHMVPSRLFPGIVLLLAAAHPASLSARGPEQEASPSALLLKLEDQNGDRFEPHAGDRLVFVVGGKEVPIETERWADELEAVLPEYCRVIRLLDLQEVPRAGGPLVRRKIRKQIGDRPKRIFLDWEGAIARRFRIRIDIPVIVALDAEGKVLRIVEGNFTAERQESIGALYR